MSAAARPSHLGLCVADLAASMRFYCEGLGFEVNEGYDLDTTMLPGLGAALEIAGPVALRSQMIRLGGMTIELLAYQEPTASGTPSRSRSTIGMTHLSFHVDDLEAMIRHLVDCGGTVLPETRQQLGIELVFLADPDGARIELMRA